MDGSRRASAMKRVAAWGVLILFCATSAALSEVVRRDIEHRRLHKAAGYQPAEVDYALRPPQSQMDLVEWSDDGGRTVWMSLLADQPGQVWYSLEDVNGDGEGDELTLQGWSGPETFLARWIADPDGDGIERADYAFGSRADIGIAYVYYDFNLDGLVDQRIRYEDTVQLATTVLLEGRWYDLTEESGNQFHIIEDDGAETEVFFDYDTGSWTRTRPGDEPEP